MSFAIVALARLALPGSDSVGSQLLFRFIAAAYERRSLAIASHWPFEEWGRFLPEHSTAVSLLDRLLHRNNIVATDGESWLSARRRGLAVDVLVAATGGLLTLATVGLIMIVRQVMTPLVVQCPGPATAAA